MLKANKRILFKAINEVQKSLKIIKQEKLPAGTLKNAALLFSRLMLCEDFK